MLTMAAKMSLLTLLYIALTAGLKLWENKNKKISAAKKRILIGTVYGFAAILSTHFGVQFDKMALNVRDIAPLAAGIFFDPVAGIIAGLIGGIERYIAGTYFSVGSYTTIACSVSTCLAGFVAAIFSLKIFHRKKATPFYAFSLGAVTEVFHMYAVLITHRNDIEGAFYVVDTCALPMIIFTGLGMFFSSAVLYALSGQIKNALCRPKKEEVTITNRFQMRLFICTLVMLIITFTFSYSVQTRTAIQNAQKTMTINTEDAKTTYAYLKADYESVMEFLKEQTTIMARSVARTVDNFGGVMEIPTERLENIQKNYSFYEINLIDKNGVTVKSSNSLNVGYDIKSSEQSNVFMDILSGKEDEFAQDIMPSGRDGGISLMYTGVKCSDGLVQVGIDEKTIKEYVNADEYANLFGDRHIGENGMIYIINSDNIIMTGKCKGESFTDFGNIPSEPKEDVSYFTANILGTESYCRLEIVKDGFKILTVLPLEEVYISRDLAAYETGFADILLFALIFIVIYILVQKIIVNNLHRINKSLTKITNGDLDESVNVRETVEFAMLSDDINLTVDALKGYIDQAEKRIEAELEFARQIQSSALPKIFNIPRDELEIFAIMDPAKEVGGDFYDFFFVDLHKIALVIADVSGKGIPASLFMMKSKTAIKGFARSNKTPGEILKLANNTLCEGNDTDMFVTVWLGIVDLETGIVKCANAGHEYPAIKHKDGEWELLKDKHGIALAAMENVNYREYEIQLNDGDKIFVYTDGVPEAINKNEEQFGTDNMIRCLNEGKEANAEKFLYYMRECVADFAGGAEQFDDITMLEFELRHKVINKEQ